jgi:hypothetical protein
MSWAYGWASTKCTAAAQLWGNCMWKDELSLAYDCSADCTPTCQAQEVRSCLIHHYDFTWGLVHRYFRRDKINSKIIIRAFRRKVKSVVNFAAFDHPFANTANILNVIICGNICGRSTYWETYFIFIPFFDTEGVPETCSIWENSKWMLHFVRRTLWEGIVYIGRILNRPFGCKTSNWTEVAQNRLGSFELDWRDSKYE